ncbi:MAG: SDR family NAD(P)-dependent oxidoreductase [Proteobacteria bacterium]|nr:SDR family NAD(P)-dependent oxidoreductase [Pseudomonadota bacterium]
MTKVCLIVGAGAGIGLATARRFAKGGYHICLIRRSNQAGLDKSINDLITNGYQASGFILDVTAPDLLEALVIKIEHEIGEIQTAVYNVGAQIGDRNLESTTLKIFELGWKLGTFGLFRLAKILIPYMLKRSSGNLLVTGATASVRGNGGQHSHTATMGSRRMLCQSLNAEFAPKGVHIAHIVIDGMIDAPDTLGKMLGADAFEDLKKRKGYEKNGLLVPDQIADTYFHLAHQHPSAWTHELDLRPYSALPWWNHQKLDL